ncbi:MAG: hypothetical protein RBG13Loki_4091 [Promethearchaeota archaeon CR_4]|nr:MAG: hypothetical protein RBG13Loki_4091 [Candidatus Lokiarchaeota archaeon CR_4]
MKGSLKCSACGYEFDVKQATFSFELSKSDHEGKIQCPRCHSEEIESA